MVTIAPPRPDEVHAQHLDEVVDGDPVRGLEVGTVEDAGRGHHARDAPEIGTDARDCLLDRGLVGHVALVCDRAPAGGVDHPGRLVGIVAGPVDDRDRRALTRGPFARRAADAAAAARHQDRSAEHAPHLSVVRFRPPPALAVEARARVR
jgi:hypothetical protein